MATESDKSAEHMWEYFIRGLVYHINECKKQVFDVGRLGSADTDHIWKPVERPFYSALMQNLKKYITQNG